MNTNIDHEGLVCLAAELNTLSTKKELTASDVARRSYLQTTISVLKMGGTTLDEINQATANRTALELGKAPTRFNELRLSPSDIVQAKAWRSIVRNDGKINVAEFRDEGIGTILPSIYQGNVGTFVPVGFLDQVFAAQKLYDPLLDPTAVNYVEYSHGRDVQFGYYDDTSTSVSLAAENSDQSGNEQDIPIRNAAMLSAYKFGSALWRTSREAFEDLEGAFNELNLFKDFAAERIARVAGNYLMNGTGSDQPTGLLTALTASGITPVVAAGAATNDGGSETGANSIGTQDLDALFFTVDPIYWQSPKCAWMMHPTTLKSIWKLVDKNGRPIIDLQNGAPMIYGKRVHLSPNMPQIGAAANVVLFGDFKYWTTGCRRDANTHVKMFQQTHGLPEKNQIGFRMFVRYDGVLTFSNWTTPPIAILQCHS